MKVDPVVIELAIVRQAREISVADVAKGAGLNPYTVYGWEHGRHSPSLWGLRRYAAALGLDVCLRPLPDGERAAGLDSVRAALRTDEVPR